MRGKCDTCSLITWISGYAAERKGDPNNGNGVEKHSKAYCHH